MWRLIFLGLIVWVVVSILKRNINSSSIPKSGKEKTEGESELENMVQCAHCAVHLPRSEAFLVDGNFYCSQAHIKPK